jgi:hypothetical protein
MMRKLQTVLSQKPASEPLDIQLVRGSTTTPTQATMSADSLQGLASVGKGQSTRGLLRVIILALIAGAAISSRLFSVIRTCPQEPPCGSGPGAQVRGIGDTTVAHSSRHAFQCSLCAN